MGFRIAVEDGRLAVTRDPDATNTIDDVRCTFDKLAREAETRLEREVTAAIGAC